MFINPVWEYQLHDGVKFSSIFEHIKGMGTYPVKQATIERNGESIIEVDAISEPLDAAVMGLEYEESWSDEYSDNTCFKIFILMKNYKISFEGSDATDGEPHYGSGFWVSATMPNDRKAQS